MTTYTAEEVRLRNGKKGADCWLIYRGNVYDVTHYADDHPGGADLVTDWGGMDCTKAFNDAGHSHEALVEFKDYKIGTLAESSSGTIEANKENRPANATKTAQKKRRRFLLCK